MHFLKAFISNPAAVGAISPSSQALAEAMIEGLGLEPEEAVLELGPGTGAFTAHILRIVSDSRHYVGVEREPSFARILSRRFPDLTIVNGLAEHSDDLYRQNGLRYPKVIISGLPSSTQPRAVLDSTVACLDRMLGPGCIFRTFQYVHAFLFPSAVHFRRRMDTVICARHIGRLVAKNLPPAVVLTWQRPETVQPEFDVDRSLPGAGEPPTELATTSDRSWTKTLS